MLPANKFAEFAPVLVRIAEGRPTSSACAEYDIEVKRFYRARKADPELQAIYVEAQELGAEALADSLQSINEEITNPLMARVVSENRRWLLARRFASRYGERIAIDDGRADLTDILREAIARIPRPMCDPGNEIEHESVTIADIFGD